MLKNRQKEKFTGVPDALVVATATPYEQLGSALAETGMNITLATQPDAIVRAGQDFLIVDDLHHPFVEALAPSQRQRVIYCAPNTEAGIAALAGHSWLDHVYCQGEAHSLKLLLGTMQKSLGLNPWGLGAYLAANARIERCVINNYGKKQDYLDRVDRFAKELGAFKELAQHATAIASELIMNAMFDAPLDRATQKPKYQNLARTTALTLAPDDSAELTIAHDNEVFALSMKDPFGALTRSCSVESLARAAHKAGPKVRKNTAGAGVGLYVMLHAASQLDFNLALGASTEVIALISLSKRYKDFESHGRGVNFFNVHHKVEG